MLTRTIDHLIIHCSAAADGVDQNIEDIDRIHKAAGFRRKTRYVRRFNRTLLHCGYHGVIHANGFYASGRHFDEWGAHVRGRNDNSIGICMVGTDRFTMAQWTSLRQTVTSIVRYIADQEFYRYPVYEPWQVSKAAEAIELTIKGHRDYSPDLNGDGRIDRSEWLKICPGFDVAQWLSNKMEPDQKHVIGV